MKRLLLMIVALLACVSVGAQVTTSSIDGRVADASGSPLLGTTVVAVHTPTGTSYATSTDAAGAYRLRNLRPGGPYTVTFSYMGYATSEQTGILLTVADSRVVNVTMEPDANVIDDVVVVAHTNLDTDLAGSVTSISTRDLNLLPTTSRSLTDMLALTPQANGASIGGGGSRDNYITVDGGSFNNMFGIGQSIPGGGTPISLDAIEQMSVSITPYDVRQSGFTGAAVNAVTRSGTNEFSGSAYTYFTNEKFQGVKVGNQKRNRSESSYNLYGVRLGGPIIKDKLFFFGSFEYEKNVEPGPSRMPSTDGVVNNDKNIARPTDADMKMISDYLKQEYGYETGPWKDYSFDSPAMRILGRVDWNINDNHRFNVRFSRMTSKYNNYPSTSSSPLSSSLFASNNNRQSMSAMWFKNSGYYQEQNFTSLAAELNSSFADGRVNNTLRFTYSDQDEPRSTDGGLFPFVDIKKDNLIYTSFGTELFSYGNLRKVKQWTLSDDVSWTWGRHDMMAGLQYEHTNTKNGFQRMGMSYYLFSSWEDFVGGADPEAYAITYPISEGYKQRYPAFNFNQFTAYVQDEWDITDRLTATIGLRLDLPTYPKMDELVTHPMIANLAFAGVDGKGGVHYDTAKLPKAKVMLSPRLGFNWDITGDRRWVLRGGTGIFTGRIPFVWIVSQSGDAGMIQISQQFTGDDVPGPFSPGRTDYLPETPAKAGTTIPTGGFTVFDPDFKMPQTWKSSLAVDMKLPWGMKGTLEGIYNRDLNPVHVFKDGLEVIGNMDVDGYGDHRLMYPYNYGDRYTHLLDGSGNLNPTGTYGATPFVVTNAPYKKSGYYASLTAKIEKPFHNGFSGMIAYTHSWAKSLSDGSGDQMYSVWQNRVTVNGSNALDMGFSGFVVPDKVVASLSYRIEYAKFMGTTVSLFYSGSSGGRFSYTYGNNFVSDGAGATSNLVYIPKDASEIQFVDYTYRDGSNNIVKWTAQEQSDAFFDYIDQDKYLRTRKGKYTERGGAVQPWENHFDVKILQDFFVTTRSGKRNTLQVSIDIMNVGNLLNKNWGLAKQTYGNAYGQTALLNVTNSSAVANGAKPTFTFSPQNGTSGANAQMLTKSYRNALSMASTYSFQIGIRYLFN